MKKTILFALSLFVAFSFVACEDTESREEIKDILVGKNGDIRELSITKFSERSVVVSGGNGKFSVNVEDSKIASATMKYDTLKVRGLLEGKTFAVIKSHDKQMRLEIKVEFPKLGFSHKQINLHPKDESKFVTLSGGGDFVEIKEDDPDDVIWVKWNGKNNIVEIRALKEGEAFVTAISEDGKEQTLDVKVRPEDNIEEPGAYGIDRRFYNNNKLMNSVLTVKREGVGTWFVNSARPYGGRIFTYNGSTMKISPIVNPTVGEKIKINISYITYEKGKIAEGDYDVLIEEVRDGLVLVRGKDFKMLIPCETK